MLTLEDTWPLLCLHGASLSLSLSGPLALWQVGLEAFGILGAREYI